MNRTGHGFLFDPNQCTGCHACELACATENDLEWGQSWRQVVTFNEERLPGIPSYHLSLACNHCAEAPCQTHCPALAIDRNPETGAVLIDDDKCIGCGYCSWACPYDAPRFDERSGGMTKCTWCDTRLSRGLEPACVERCPTTALRFGPMDGLDTRPRTTPDAADAMGAAYATEAPDAMGAAYATEAPDAMGATDATEAPDAMGVTYATEAGALLESLPGFPRTPARPSIRFTPLRATRSAPESTWEIPGKVLDAYMRGRRPDADPVRVAPKRVSHAKVAPTQVSPTQVAPTQVSAEPVSAEPVSAEPVSAARVSPTPTSAISLRREWPLYVFTSVVALLVGWVLAGIGGAGPPQPVLFLVLVGLAGGASSMHLGRRSRMLRAVLNVRRSWLSREILLFGCFVAASAVLLLRPWALGGNIALAAAGISGLALAFSIDRVYDIVRPGSMRLHSADILLTSLLIAALVAREPLLMITVALLKLGLYVLRLRSSNGSVLRWPVRILRLVGLASALFLALDGRPVEALWAAVALGELIDRAEFYADLETRSPHRQAAIDLAAQTNSLALRSRPALRPAPD